MRTICLYFQVHQPFRLRRYRFFNIGTHHDYFDDFANRNILRRIADKCYLPANKLMLELIKKHGKKFKITYSISGYALEQFEMYAPEVLDSFKKLAKTGCVEFLAETYSHSLAGLKNKDEFSDQVIMHTKRIQQLFGQNPSVFRNTELIYSDEIGAAVAEMGFDAMLTEGAKHILGWKSPNYLYTNAKNPKLKILLRNFKLTDDIAFRFSNKAWPDWPLTPEKFVGWIDNIDPIEELVNIFMDYETFGEHQWADTGIFDFLKRLPETALKAGLNFSTPSEIIKQFQPVAPINVPYPISWADEERDLTAWLGNELQNDAFNKLYSLYNRVIDKPEFLKEWRYLQTSDHFYYMCTKWFSDGEVHKYFNPYESPYDAYINYMNVLNDFIIRLDKADKPIKTDKLIEELEQKDEIIEKLKKELGKIKRTRKAVAKEPEKAKPVKKSASAKKADKQQSEPEIKSTETVKAKKTATAKTKKATGTETLTKTATKKTPVAKTKDKESSKAEKQEIKAKTAKAKKTAASIEVAKTSTKLKKEEAVKELKTTKKITTKSAQDKKKSVKATKTKPAPKVAEKATEKKSAKIKTAAETKKSAENSKNHNKKTKTESKKLSGKTTRKK